MLRLSRVQGLPLLLRLGKVWKQSDDEIDICFDAGLGIAERALESFGLPFCQPSQNRQKESASAVLITWTPQIGA